MTKFKFKPQEGAEDQATLINHYFSEIDDNMRKGDIQEDFIESLRDQWEEKNWLSEGQIYSLEKCYSRVTS